VLFADFGAAMARVASLVTILAAVLVLFLASSVYIYANFSFSSQSSLAGVSKATSQSVVSTSHGSQDSPVWKPGLDQLRKLLATTSVHIHHRAGGPVTFLLTSLIAQPGRPNERHMDSSNFFPTCFELLQHYRNLQAAEEFDAIQLLVEANCAKRAIFVHATSSSKLQDFAQAVLPSPQQVQHLAKQLQAAHDNGAALSSSMRLVAVSEAVSSLWAICAQARQQPEQGGAKGLATVLCSPTADAQQLLSIIQRHNHELLKGSLQGNRLSAQALASLRAAGVVKGPSGKRAASNTIAPEWVLETYKPHVPTEYSGWHSVDSPWLPVTALWVLLGAPSGSLPPPTAQYLEQALQLFASPFGYAVLCSPVDAPDLEPPLTELHAAVQEACAQALANVPPKQTMAVVMPFLNALLHWASIKHGLFSITAGSAAMGGVLARIQGGGERFPNSIPPSHSGSIISSFVVSALSGFVHTPAALGAPSPSHWRPLEEGGVKAAAVLSPPGALDIAALQYFVCNTRDLHSDTAEHCAAPAVRGTSWDQAKGAAPAAGRTAAVASAAPPSVRGSSGVAKKAEGGIATLCAPQGGGVSPGPLLGVPKTHRMAPAYAACCGTDADTTHGTFVCPDSAMSLACSRVNDGWCDCAASCADEPSTSATGADRAFWCASGMVRPGAAHALSQQAPAQLLQGLELRGEGGVLKWPPAQRQGGGSIPASRVGDGVCDCLGGEDEMQWGGGGAASCAQGELCAVCLAAAARFPHS